MIKVVDVRRERCSVYCGRGTPVGNQFIMRDESMRDQVCDDYKDWIRRMVATKDKHVVGWLNKMLDRLSDGEYITLGCHCAPRRCHCDTLKEILTEMFYNQSFNSQKPKPIYRWSIHSGYECSTLGDKRFSALCARMPDGRTLESHYQCDQKLFDPGGTNWKLGKGKPAKDNCSRAELYERYLGLWRIWVAEHPELLEELRECADRNEKVLRDSFGKTNINQARALAQLLSETDPSQLEQP